MDVVLVRVDADGEPALVLRGLQHAEPGGARRRVDDVGAAIELAPRQLAAARGIVPGRGRRAGHVLEDLDLRIDVPGAFFVAERESANQWDVHAADEPDLAGLRRHRRGHADQERALVLLEHDRLDVGQLDDRVHDGELEVRELLGDLLHAARLGKADPHDDRRAATRHVAQRLLALGLVGHLELAIRDPGLFLETLGPGVRRLVEGFVEFPAHVEHDGGRELLSRDGAHLGQRDEDRDGGAERSRGEHVRAPCVRRSTGAPMI